MGCSENNVSAKPAIHTMSKFLASRRSFHTLINGCGSNSVELVEGAFICKNLFCKTTEVTQGQWKTVMGSNPSTFSACGSNCPVEQVSWDNCQEFIQRLNQKEGTSKYRLPTEAEWEYACRAGTTGPYAGDLDSMGWYDGNSGRRTHLVGQKKPNAWGLYDMHGNVWEWCSDWYGEDTSGSITDPEGPSSGPSRVLRGGSWNCEPRVRALGNSQQSRPCFLDQLQRVSLHSGQIGYRWSLLPLVGDRGVAPVRDKILRVAVYY